jgi:hypothetical protein
MYCTIEDIEGILNTDYFKGHKPTDRGQLKLLGGIISNDIDGTLLQYGYTLPVIDTKLLLFLSSTNVIGVAAIVAPREIPMDMNKRYDNIFERMYNRAIKQLITRHWIGGFAMQTTDERTW